MVTQSIAAQDGADAAAELTELERVRNIGVLAHIDAGKTTLSERILFYTGVNQYLGEVHEGTATTDWMIQERERGISITSASTVCSWRGHRINLIDTPGHVDFTAEVERSLRVLDGAVAVFCAVGGVQTQSEAVWRQARRHGVPVIAFVNKMDRVGADLSRVCAGIHDRLGVPAVPLQIPYGREDDFRGVVDILARELLVFDTADYGRTVHREPLPADLENAWDAGYEHLVECLAEHDDAVLEAYLSGAALAADTLRRALRRATIAHDLVPVLCGSSLKNTGVQPVLDAVVDFLPSPVDIGAVNGICPASGQHTCRTPDHDAPFAAYAFKTVHDRRAGRLAFCRVYAGRARQGDTVQNSRTGRLEPLQHLLQMHADQWQELPHVSCGDIAAITGLDDTITGDTLYDPDAPIAFEPLHFPEPVASVALEPRDSGHAERLVDALERVRHDDPTVQVTRDPDTGQLLLSGMGELHLDILVDRLQREASLDIRVGRPQVAYRETVLAAAEAEGSLDRRNDAGDHRARVRVRVSARPSGSGSRIVHPAGAHRLPEPCREAVEQGIADAIARGPVAGDPVTDIDVTVLDAGSPSKPPSETACRAAAATAVRTALRNARPVRLEPLMTAEITVPHEHLGDVIAGIASRRGQVTEIDTLAQNRSRILARVPLAELFGYATALRSVTRGTAEFIAEPSHFEAVPQPA